MKKIILLVICSFVMLVACTKAPMNGELEGLWQLTRIETNDDTISTRQYWSFQLKLLQLDNGYFYSRFEHDGNELRVYDIVAGESNNFVDKNGSIECLIEEKDLAYLHKYGIYRLDTRFKIETLSSNYMNLRSEDAHLYFRKY